MRQVERPGLVQPPRLQSEAWASHTLVYPSPLYNQRQARSQRLRLPVGTGAACPACHLCACKREIIQHTETSPWAYLLHTAGAHICGVRHTTDSSQRGA
jgi:hypothetical protein